MYAFMVLQTVFAPFGMGMFAGRSRQQGGTVQALALLLIWLSAYLWIRGLPAFPPVEALDWLGLFGSAAMVVLLVGPTSRTWIRLSCVLLLSFVAYAWPLFQGTSGIVVAVELTLFAMAGVLTLIRLQQTSKPSAGWIFVVSGAGFALATALGGSLLIAQLAVALAACLAGVLVMRHRARSTPIVAVDQPLMMVTFFYVGLLFIARLYTEMSILVISGFLVAPLITLLVRWRFGWVLGSACVGTVLIHVIVRFDPHSYY